MARSLAAPGQLNREASRLGDVGSEDPFPGAEARKPGAGAPPAKLMLRRNPRLKNAQLLPGNPDLGAGLSIAFSAMLREIRLSSAEVPMARVMSAAATD